jgi:hypothetical protein
VRVWVRGAGGAKRHRARPKAERGVGAGVGAGGVAPSRHGGPGVNPQKNVEITDARR